MKESHVRKCITDDHVQITENDWRDAINKGRRVYIEGNVTIMFDDLTAINLQFYSPRGCSSEDCMKAVKELCTSLRSHTGAIVQVNSIL